MSSVYWQKTRWSSGQICGEYFAQKTGGPEGPARGYSRLRLMTDSSDGTWRLWASGECIGSGKVPAPTPDEAMDMLRARRIDLRAQVASCRQALRDARWTGRPVQWPDTPDIAVRPAPSSDGGILLGVWQWAHAPAAGEIRGRWRAL